MASDGQHNSVGRPDAEKWRNTAEEIFSALPPPPIPRLQAEDAFDLAKYKNKPNLTPAQAVQNCADAMEKYDAEECKACREEIDTLLVFAGLFSAVVTAFSIESYQWLQSDPNDAIIALLSQIAQPANRNESAVAVVQTGLPDAVSARINAYWFLSLIFSLSAALVAILCKQWVREFERHTGLSDAVQFIEVRQMKLQGFESWRVSGIVAAIPLLLQSALGLFALGLVELLWNLHFAVAIVVLIPTTVALVFYTLTTLFPAVQIICSPFRKYRRVSQCPFKSAQAMLALRTLVLLRCIVYSFFGILKVLPVRGFIYRKCVASWRSMHLFWSSKLLGKRPHSFPRRPASIWQGNESSCVDSCADPPTRPSWRSHVRRLWRFLLSWKPDRWLSRSRWLLDSSGNFPTSKQMESSWLGLDRKFASLRDMAYTSEEYGEALMNPEENTIPPGFYFSGLSWLRDHLHQPSTESWIFLSTWHILYTFRNGLWRIPRPDEWLLYAQRYIDPSYVRFVRPQSLSDQTSLVFLFATHAGLDTAFLSEICIHHLPGLEDDGDAAAVDMMKFSWGNAGGALSSRVYAILALVLRSVSGGQDTLSPGASRFLLYAFGAIDNDPEFITDAMFAVLVALYLRDARLTGGSMYNGVPMQTLLLIALQRLGTDHDAGDRTPAVMAVFAELAHAVYRDYEAIGAIFDQSDAWVASQLVMNRAGYLDLLATALGSRSAAEDHFNGHIVWLAQHAAHNENWAHPSEEPPLAISFGGQRSGTPDRSQNAVDPMVAGYDSNSGVKEASPNVHAVPARWQTFGGIGQGSDGPP